MRLLFLSTIWGSVGLAALLIVARTSFAALYTTHGAVCDGCTADERQRCAQRTALEEADEWTERAWKDVFIIDFDDYVGKKYRVTAIEVSDPRDPLVTVEEIPQSQLAEHEQKGIDATLELGNKFFRPQGNSDRQRNMGLPACAR